MMDTVVSPLFNPEVESMLCTLLMSISLLFSLTIIFFVFLTLRIDTFVVWSWATVWIPAWITNVILFYSLIRYILTKADEKEEEDEEEEKEDNGQMKRLKQHERYLRRAKKFVILFNFVLFVLFQIFIVIRLDEVVSWTACIVFIPYFVFEGIHLFVTSLKVLVGCMALISVKEKGKIPSFMFGQYWLNALRFCFFLLVALRVDQIIQCSWGIVFIPLYLIGLKCALQLAYKYFIYSRMPQPEIAHQGKVTVLVGVIAFIVIGLLFYALVALIAQRLDGNIYIKMSNVFVPLFIVFVSHHILSRNQFLTFFINSSLFYFVARDAVFRVYFEYQQYQTWKNLKQCTW
jgi:hypothetical protein